jgi:hypothetical protein
MKRFAPSRARRALVIAVGALAVGVLAPVASADKPVRIPPAPSPDDVIPDSCAFPVLEHYDVNNETVSIYADGRVKETGAFKVTLTNVNDPSKSAQLNIPGPGTITATSDGGSLLTAQGPWLFIFAPGDLGPGTPGMLVQTTGKATLLTNPDGSQVFTHKAGTTTDVCALLA